MRGYFLMISGVSVLGMSGCWLDNGSTPVTTDTASGDDTQISGSDAISGTDASSGTDAISGTDVSADTDTASGDVTIGCTVGTDTCGAGKFCSAPTGQCGGTGTCAAKPQVCPMDCGAFCGCDGKAYCTEGIATGAGDVLAHSGACGAATQWLTTCGAPVCSGVKPIPGVAACTTQKAGDACTAGAAPCDLQNACQQELTCTDKDPKLNPGGCPISRRAKKTDIRYLDADDVAKLQTELLATKLATYKYRDAGPQAPQQLGFIIDDQPDSPAVDARRDMVDLYGYLSMSVAALQAQQKQLVQQARRIEQLEAAVRDASVCR